MSRIRLGIVALLALASLPTAVAAQGDAPSRKRWEMLLSSGALLPTGTQRDAIKPALLSTAQLSYVTASRLAVTTMFGWARSRDLVTANDPKLDVFSFDIGAELRAPRASLSASMSFTPFAGVGAGSRSYNHRDLNVQATHNVAGYVAAGGEVTRGRLRVRAEVRDYVTGFKPLDGAGSTAARNDVVALVGLRIARRGS